MKERMEAWPVGWLSFGENEAEENDMNEKITLDNGWPSHGRLLKSDASPRPGGTRCDGCVREKDAGR
jgi:hypothetical protein